MTAKIERKARLYAVPGRTSEFALEKQIYDVIKEFYFSKGGKLWEISA